MLYSLIFAQMLLYYVGQGNCLIILFFLDNDSGVAFREIMVSLFSVIIHQIIIIFTIIMSVNINRERVMLQSNSVTHNLQSGPPNLLIVAFYLYHTCKFKFLLAKSWGFIPGGEGGGVVL